MSKGLGIDQTKVYWSTDIDIIKLVGGVSCSYKCTLVSCGGYVVSECNKEEWSISSVCFYAFEHNRTKLYHNIDKGFSNSFCFA
jgi:hypothetical protein